VVWAFGLAEFPLLTASSSHLWPQVIYEQPPSKEAS